MSYFKILRAQRKSGSPPTIKKTPMSHTQQRLAEQGNCIKCGENKAANNSYVCTGCQEEDTLEDIQKEIQNLRSRLLKKSEG